MLSGAFSWRLLLFHRLLRLFAALGAGFGALLALFIEHLLGAQQLDEGLFRPIALLETGANDAQIAAIAVAVARRHRLKETGDGLAGHQVRQGAAPAVKIALLTQRDQP